MLCLWDNDQDRSLYLFCKDTFYIFKIRLCPWLVESVHVGVLFVDAPVCVVWEKMAGPGPQCQSEGLPGHSLVSWSPLKAPTTTRASLYPRLPVRKVKVHPFRCQLTMCIIRESHSRAAGPFSEQPSWDATSLTVRHLGSKRENHHKLPPPCEFSRTINTALT